MSFDNSKHDNPKEACHLTTANMTIPKKRDIWKQQTRQSQGSVSFDNSKHDYPKEAWHL